MIPDRPPIERQKYWQGQTLRSSDLNDQRSLDEQVRWWHNRSIHEAYGVSAGLQVSVRGNDLLILGSGIAYDCRGRELLQRNPTSLSLANQSGQQLTLLLKARTNNSPDFGYWQNADAFRHEPELRLVETPQVTFTDGVPLAQLRRAKDSLAWTLVESFAPPRARAIARDRVYSATTIAGQTAWRSWEIGIPEPDPATGIVEFAVSGIEVEIDTSSAGFTQTPCYFGWLQTGLLATNPIQKLFSLPAQLLFNQGVFGTSKIPDMIPQLLPFFSTRIHSCTPTGFTYSLVDLSPRPQLEPGASESVIRYYRRLTSQANRKSNIEEVLQLASQAKFHVCWFGIQPDIENRPDQQLSADQNRRPHGEKCHE